MSRRPRIEPGREHGDAADDLEIEDVDYVSVGDATARSIDRVRNGVDPGDGSSEGSQERSRRIERELEVLEQRNYSEPQMIQWQNMMSG